MNRHLARTLAMQTLYEWDFQPHKSATEMLESNLLAADQVNNDATFVKKLVTGAIDHKDDIDKLVAQHAPEWPLDQISAIDKSILRVAIFELKFCNDVPAKVIINEAVELAKTFGGDNTSRFVNGVLGTIYRQSDRYLPEDDIASNSKSAL